MDRTNDIVINAYQFLRLWILILYKAGIDIPIITTDTIEAVFKTISKCGNQGNKPTGEKLILLNKFNIFYENIYIKLNPAGKINSSGTDIS